MTISNMVTTFNSGLTIYCRSQLHDTLTLKVPVALKDEIEFVLDNLRYEYEFVNYVNCSALDKERNSTFYCLCLIDNCSKEKEKELYESIPLSCLF